MTHRSVLCALALCCWGMSIAAAQSRSIVIRIDGRGANARYLAEGATSEEPVEISIGDTVTWTNEGNVTHTATSELEDENGVPLIDTGDLSPGDSSDPQEITREMFAAARGTPGGTAELVYLCDHHPNMGSSLVLNERDTPSSGDKNTAGTAETRSARSADRSARHADGLLTRRDITSLSATELGHYRDAWRAIQSDGTFDDIAGHHGCPDYFCHRPGDRVIFLPWHREFVLRLENALGEPVHYWDWTSSDSQVNGIPLAFTESTYQSPADGNFYPNPLRAHTYQCPPGSFPDTTFRNPRAPFLLAQYASEVQLAYAQTGYATFNSNIENPPHDSLHGWVGGRMGAVTFASYDPVFWAHHANVDRQWASWQRGGGANPDAATGSRALTGFGGRTVADVLDISMLGYRYDRYDTMPSRHRPVADRTLLVAADDLDESPQTAGVGKTFRVRAVPERDASEEAASGPLHLFVEGLAEHPRESYFVYVFVNQPDATLSDATRENPHFAGAFGVFGSPSSARHDQQADQRPSEPRRVMQLFAGRRNVLEEPISQVTLITTNETGAIVSREQVPFDAVSIRASAEAVAADQPAEMMDEPQERRRRFTGVSDRESFSDAYRRAADQAQQTLASAGADIRIATKVVSITGLRGGIEGATRLSVTIEAWVE